MYDGSNLTITDSSHAKTGAITGTFKNYIASDAGCCLFHVHGGSSLTLENVSITVTAEPHESNADAVRAMDSNITIKEGVTISHPGKFYPEHSYRDLDGNSYALRTDGKCKVIIDGGVFDGHVKLSGYQDTNGSIQISGGTFKKDVQVLYTAEENNSDPAVTVNGGTFEGNVYLQYWPWKTSLYMPYRLNGGTFKGTVDLYADDGIFEKDKPTGNPNIALGLDKCFGYSAVVTPGGTFTGPNAYTGVLEKFTEPHYEYYEMWLKGSASNPVKIIPNAWGMKSVTLDGNVINYAKDWKGAAVEIDNSKDRTITFKWKDLADELVKAGYSYDAKCEHYVSGSTAVQETENIAAGKTSHTITIEKGAEPKVYSFDLKLNLKKDGNLVGIVHNQHIVKLVVSEAPPAPPAPVAHSITIINGFGTATPKKAIAGESITVKANDRTADNMMFTQWYTETPGVTFANATQRETTFVMPDSDVKVNPGYHGVSFTNQPVPQISLEKGYGGKTSFAFSWDISKWELVDTATNQTVSSDNTPVKAGKLTDVTIPANTDLGHKTYRIVVTTANGEQFKSNDFIVTWFEKMPAPLVEFSIPSDTKFIGEMTVNVGYPDELNDGTLSPYVMYYTTNGVDPKDADPSDVEDCHGSTDVTLNNTTTIKARTILKGEGGNENTWGELCEATYTMIDKLDAPTVTPESCSYSGSLPIIVTIQDVYNAEIDFSVKQHDGYLSGGDEPGPMLETGLPDTFCGTTTFRAKAIVYKDGGGAWESDEVTYTYTREYWANISNATISGKVNKAIADTDVTITLDGEKFKDVAVGDDVSGWFNLPEGLTAKVKEQTSYSRELVITISGTPTATSAATITVTIPKDKLLANGTVDLTVLSNPKAVYNIGTDAAHTHDYTGQPYLYLDPGNHYQECTAGDGYNILAHEFTPWTDNENGTHSRHCTVCKMKDGTDYTETAEHTWVWVVDKEAALGQPGKQHEECVDCPAKRSENTEIPALTAISAVNVTVTAPVKDAAPEDATTTAGSPYSVADTAWEPPIVSGTFAGGTKYTVKVSLEATGNNRFTDTTTFHINGKAATIVTKTGEEAVITLTFDATEGTPAATEFTVTVKDDGNGTASTSHATAAAGTEITLTATPNSGYHFKEWQVIKGGSVTITNNKFNMPADNVEVKAIFEKNSSTGGGGGGGVTTYPITVKSAKNGDVTASHKTASKGTAVTLTVDPDKGYVLDALTVLDGKDKEIKLTEKNGKYTFTMPASKVTVEAAFKASAPTGKNPFTDVPAGSYYEDAVIWAVDKGITTGTSATTFNPNGICTRAQAVTFLWRAAGSPAAKSAVMPFTDVKAGSYYYDAVLWAVENGITKGTSDTTFSPDATCSRAQIVTFLWRANGSPAVSGNSAFTDVASDAYYAAAVTWAEKNDVTGGIGGGLFGSNNNCTRAQIVTFIYRSVK